MKRTDVLVPGLAVVGLACLTVLAVAPGIAEEVDERGGSAIQGSTGESAPSPKIEPFDEALRTTSGRQLVVEGRDGLIRAFEPTPKGNDPLADGLYRLESGGAIEVKKGIVVSDEYGGVEKYREGVLSPGLG